MIRIFLVSIMVMVGLVGCNMRGAPVKEIIPTLTSTQDVQITSTAAEETAASTSTTMAIVPIPSSSVQIEGVSYTAYQIPGDPFRFVCQDPCILDPQYIYAEYAGFRPAHAALIQMTGVDTLAELQPVDMHLGFEDNICRVHPGGHASLYAHAHQAYTCTDGPGIYPTLEEKIQMAALPESQYFPLHEYMHTIIFGRISTREGNFVDGTGSFFHDFVNPVPSFAIGILNPAEFCSYYGSIAPGEYGGWLIPELCQKNGFQLKDLALSLTELDNLYQSGGGKQQEGFEHLVPTVAQYRDILNSVLGSDTTQAFAAACWAPQWFGNSYSLPSTCQNQSEGGSPTGDTATGGTPTPIK